MKSGTTVDLSVIATIYNAEAIVASLVKRIQATVSALGISFEIILVDDGSADNSAFAIEDQARHFPEVKGLILSRNFGQQVAMSAGISHASGKYALIMDGDLQNPPEAIPGLYAKIQEGYDIVYTASTQRNNGVDRATSWLFWRLLNSISQGEIVKSQLMMRIMSSRVVSHYKSYPEKVRTVAAITHDIGMRSTVINIDNEKRAAGRSNYTTLKRLNLAIDVILDFTNHPLNVLFYAGLLIMFATGILSAVYLYLFLTSSILPGFTTLVLLSMFFGSVNLISLGLLARYIANIYTEVKQRPLFFVRKFVNLENEDGS